MGRKLSKIYTRYNSLPLLFLIIASFFLKNCIAEEITSSPLTPLKVVDGDSLEIGSSRIRLIGIDAPEYLQHCKYKNKNRPCGKQATAYLKKLTTNKTVRCTVHEKDQYDRFLCTCYVDELDLNAEMIRSGNAVTYLDSPYAAEQNEAKTAKRGIWQTKFMQPRLYRRLKELQKSK